MVDTMRSRDSLPVSALVHEFNRGATVRMEYSATLGVTLRSPSLSADILKGLVFKAHPMRIQAPAGIINMEQTIFISLHNVWLRRGAISDVASEGWFGLFVLDQEREGRGKF